MSNPHVQAVTCCPRPCSGGFLINYFLIQRFHNLSSTTSSSAQQNISWCFFPDSLPRTMEYILGSQLAHHPSAGTAPCTQAVLSQRATSPPLSLSFLRAYIPLLEHSSHDSHSTMSLLPKRSWPVMAGRSLAPHGYSQLCMHVCRHSWGAHWCPAGFSHHSALWALFASAWKSSCL